MAQVSKACISWTATYGVDIAPDESDLLALCSVLALEADQTRDDQGSGSGNLLGGAGNWL